MCGRLLSRRRTSTRGCVRVYELSDNRRFKCAACSHKFSVTSGTIFANRKLAIRDTGYWVVDWLIDTFEMRPPETATATVTFPRRLVPVPE